MGDVDNKRGNKCVGVGGIRKIYCPFDFDVNLNCSKN